MTNLLNYATMIISHRIAMDTNCKQLDYFIQAAGTARFTWNYALLVVKVMPHLKSATRSHRCNGCAALIVRNASVVSVKGGS